MKSHLAAFVSGSVFAIGLAVSGMTQPAKVVGFLDVAGAWDPSLAFVMLGAVAVYFVAYRLIRGRKSPWFDTKLHLPTRKDIDVRLVMGSAVFGMGWGLAGYCPGPGLVSAGAGSLPAIAFVLAMTLGIFAEQRVAMAWVHARPKAVPPADEWVR